MRKTVNINISGTVFYIDDDAYARLKDYLTTLEKYFSKQQEGVEIYRDIECRIAELFNEKVKDKTGVINIDLVESVINKMGEPTDFAEDVAEEPTSSHKGEKASYTNKKRLYRDRSDGMLAGVCSGIAAYLNADPVLIRVIFVIAFFTLGIIVPVYIILWIVIPEAITTAQRLEMRGENVTIKNIEKAIKNEFEDVKKQFGRVRDTDAYRKGESWWNKLTKRDKNMLLVVAVIGGAVLLANLIGFNFYDGGTASLVNFHHGFSHFPGVLILVLILLVIGFIFKSIFKIIIYIIAFLFIILVALKVFGFMVGSVFMLC